MLRNNEYIYEQFIDSFEYEPSTGHIYYTSRMTGEARKVGVFKIKGDGYLNDYLYVYLRYRRARYEIAAHKLAWRLYYGEWPSGRLKHKNRVKSDNRIDNIILVKGSKRSKENV